MKSLKLKVQSFILKFKIFTFFIIIFNFPFLIFNLRQAKAQSFSLSVSPPLLEVMMMPGKTITQVYEIRNGGNDAMIFSKAVSFEADGNLGNISVKPADLDTVEPSYPWLNWFRFQNADISLPGTFFVKKGDKQQLVLKIKVPENAEEKDYYASLIFKVNPGDKIGSGPQASGIISTNILLTVSKDGKPPKNARISVFSVKPNKIYDLGFKIYDSFDNIPLTLKVVNEGRYLIAPLGSVKIINPLDQEMEFLEIPEQNVLAFSERKLLALGNEEEVLKEINWLPRGFNLGKYKAKASLILANSDIKLEAETSFILIPWKAGLIILGTLILLQFMKKILGRVFKT